MPFPARRFLFGFSNLQDSQVEGKGQRVEAEGGFESWDFLGADLNGEFLEVHIVSTKCLIIPIPAAISALFFKWDLENYSSDEIDPFLNTFLSKGSFCEKNTPSLPG